MKKENRALKSAPASIQESVVAPSRKKHRSSLLGTIIRRSLLVFFSVIIMLFSALLLVLNLVFNGPSPTARNQLTMTLIEQVLQNGYRRYSLARMLLQISEPVL